MNTLVDDDVWLLVPKDINESRPPLTSHLSPQKRRESDHLSDLIDPMISVHRTRACIDFTAQLHESTKPFCPYMAG